AEGGYGLDACEVERVATPDTRAIVPVHLYGECMDLSALLDVAHRLGAVVIEDACQAHGARLGGKAAGTFGAAAAFSFYPTKNLGAFGDAGLIATDDTAVAGRLRKLRDYGRSCRDLFEEPGRNSRLDELQAAMLRIKLERLDAWNERRRSLAALYAAELEGLPLDLPRENEPGSHVYHLYVVATDGRDALKRHLEERDIAALVHYPVCPHLQDAFANLGYGPGDFPRAESAAAHVLSLPLHPWLSDQDAMTVAREVRAFFG
ncbi:MAG: DegT/DnrJ/EryC1/StrS family aminotransferase, partial [Actinomycetota bacterium]